MSDDDVPVVHADDLPWVQLSSGTLFDNRSRALGRAAGGRQLGCRLVEVPPGKAAWPFHYHLGNEEAIYVLEGEATLRLAEGRRRIRAGDYAAFVAGKDGVHQLINTSDAPVRYLVLSTMRHPDVTGYPDSNKIGVFAGSAPGGDPDARVDSGYVSRDAFVGYWTGEDASSDEPTGGDDDDDPEARMRRVDEEIARMKKQLGLE